MQLKEMDIKSIVTWIIEFLLPKSNPDKDGCTCRNQTKSSLFCPKHNIMNKPIGGFRDGS